MCSYGDNVRSLTHTISNSIKDVLSEGSRIRWQEEGMSVITHDAHAKDGACGDMDHDGDWGETKGAGRERSQDIGLRIQETTGAVVARDCHVRNHDLSKSISDSSRALLVSSASSLIHFHQLCSESELE